MKINTKIIERLRPCEDRLNNYLKYYKDFDGTLEDFILLDNITYNDKVWVVTRLFTKAQNVKWAILCASKVLSIFENKYPNDKRPRNALEAAEKWLLNPNEKNTMDSSYATTNAAYAANAYYTAEAYYAAYAACYAAYAINAAKYTTFAAYYAAYAAYYTDYDYDAISDESGTDNKLIEQEVNLILMLECV